MICEFSPGIKDVFMMIFITIFRILQSMVSYREGYYSLLSARTGTQTDFFHIIFIIKPLYYTLQLQF